MTKWIGAVVLAMTFITAGSDPIEAAAAVPLSSRIQASQSPKASVLLSDVSARRHYYRYHRYAYRRYAQPYHPNYYARPYYYEP